MPPACQRVTVESDGTCFYGFDRADAIIILFVLLPGWPGSSGGWDTITAFVVAICLGISFARQRKDSDA